MEPVVIADGVSDWLEGAPWVEVLDRATAAWLPAVARALHRTGALDRPGRESASGPAPAGPDPLAGVPHNLPATATAPIGREGDLAQVRAGLGTHRLVSLTGSGGVGKTCLALAAAGGLGPVFPDGVWLVDLAPIPAPAAAVGAHLAGRTALPLLVNLDHLMAAGAFVAELLEACPDPRVLATSRAPLRLAGEWVVPAPPLAAPDPSDLATSRSRPLWLRTRPSCSSWTERPPPAPASR